MNEHDLVFTPASELANLIAAKEISSVELTEIFLSRIDHLDHNFHAYITVAHEQAITSARDADSIVAEGKTLSPLHGVPIGVKDLATTKGITTTRGSLALNNFVPDNDEVMVSRLKAAGLVILGKTNLPEFGHLPTNENRLGEPCRNPWNTAMTSGGSSGGAAAGLAAGLHPLATGTDAGGSIRIPASFCGVFGIRPTQGRVPKFYQPPGGWMIFAQAGPMTHTVKDSAFLLQIMAGHDMSDPSSLNAPIPDFSENIELDIKGLRLGWSPNIGSAPVDPEIAYITGEAAKSFEQLGAIVEETDIAIDQDQALELFKTMFMSDLAAGTGALAAARAADLSDTLLSQIEEAQSWSASKLALALRELEWHRSRMKSIVGKYDLLLTPTLATKAFEVGQSPSSIDGHKVDPVWGFTPFTYPFNMSGHPAASIPCGFSEDGLPIGLHVIGQVGDEASILQASHAFEVAHPWNKRRPIFGP